LAVTTRRRYCGGWLGGKKCCSVHCSAYALGSLSSTPTTIVILSPSPPPPAGAAASPMAASGASFAMTKWIDGLWGRERERVRKAVDLVGHWWQCVWYWRLAGHALAL
jgi:hypothetical protein